ncbi:MAG: V4R domain-containing protein [archaeon]
MGLSPILKKFLFVRQFDMDNGKVTLLGDRRIMLDASAVLELQDLDETKLYDVGKKSGLQNLSGFVEHAKVYGKMKDVFMSDITMLGKKIGSSDQGAIRTLQDIFNIFGLGEMTIQEIDNSGKKAIISLRESTLASEWTLKYKKSSKNTVCALTAGVIAGMFSYIFGKPVDCIEASCKAQGKGYCLFKVG